MNRIWRSAVIVAGLVFTLGGASSWGGAPPNNDVSDNMNTAGGTDALKSNTTGANNTAFGDAALFHNTSGFRNTAFGSVALFLNTTGNDNTASGVSALGANTTGSGNTASGSAALFSHTTGDHNTAFGDGALFHNTSGSNNTAVGVGAGFYLTSGDNNIYLGNPGAATESNTMRLGDDQTHTFIAGIAGTPLLGRDRRDRGVHLVFINSQGQLGVLASSARYKRDIQAMGERSQGLFQLRPVTFRYKQEAQGQRQYGLIAEEVAAVYPELVTRGAKGEVESVQYHELIPMLLNEVQHQQQELVELKAQNESLRAALAQQQGRDEEQRAQNAALAARLERLEAGAARAAKVSSH